MNYDLICRECWDGDHQSCFEVEGWGAFRDTDATCECHLDGHRMVLDGEHRTMTFSGRFSREMSHGRLLVVRAGVAVAT